MSAEQILGAILMIQDYIRWIMKPSKYKLDEGVEAPSRRALLINDNYFPSFTVVVEPCNQDHVPGDLQHRYAWDREREYVCPGYTSKGGET